MNQFPPFTPTEIAGQRCYLGLAILLTAFMGALIWKPTQLPQGLRVAIWSVIPFSSLYLLNSGHNTGVTVPALTATFVLHCLLNAAGVGFEIKRNQVAQGSAAILIAMILCVLLYPTVSTPRWSARMHQCRNKMKLLGLAVHNNVEVGEFRPVNGNPPLSWRVQVLPFLDAKPLGEGYHRALEWDSSENQKVGQRRPLPYRCPNHPDERTESGFMCTDYALVTGLGTIFPSPETVLDFGQVRDGTSNTILMVECAGQKIPWTEPRDVDVTRQRMTLNERDSTGGSPSLISSYDTDLSHERKWCHVLMADGSVRRLDPATTDPHVLSRLVTANAGDHTSDF